MRETASGGMALSPTGLRAGLLRSRTLLSLRDISPRSGESPSQRAEGLASLCEGGVRGADGGRELAGIAIFPFIEKSGRIYEKHLWKCRQYDDFW